MVTSNSLRSIAVFILATGLALWLGISIVTSQSETLLMIAGGGLLLTCIFLGRKIWLLLIFFTALDVPIIRGFGTTEIGQFLFIGFTLLITLLRSQPFKFHFGEKEIWVLLLAGCVLQAYLRNPVGLSMFGADAVGARPYFMICMAFISSLVLGNIAVRSNELKWALRLSIIGSLLGVALYQLRIGLVVRPSAFQQGQQIDDGQGSSRIDFLVNLANATARMSVSFISPLRALLHPFWAPLVLFCVLAAAMSGYRNAVASVGLVFLAGVAYRSGTMAVVSSLFVGVLGLALLSFVNLINPLPPNIQRALSPFPGTWEERHVKAAEDSTEWRVEMWKDAILTDYWIQNKIFGDGLGFTRKELLMMEDINAGGGTLDNRGSGMSRQQEAMMVTGGYHSGPVQTVRAVGYVGLAVLLLVMIRMAVHAHRQIIRCRGTEWFPLALYFGIPAIVLPPFFVLIIGSFGNSSVAVFYSYALISLLEKNLPLPAYVPRVAYRNSPLALQNQRTSARS